MKIRIKKCDVETYWYFNKVGNIHKVIRAVEYPRGKGFGYEVFSNGHKYVDVDDAEIVFEDFNEGV